MKTKKRKEKKRRRRETGVVDEEKCTAVYVFMIVKRSATC